MYVEENPALIEGIFRMLLNTLQKKEDAKYLHKMINDLAQQVGPHFPERYKFMNKLPFNYGIEPRPRNMPENHDVENNNGNGNGNGR